MNDEVRRRLALALVEVDMVEAAQLALEGFYSDTDSPLAAPKMTLVETLWTRAEMEMGKGDFDAQTAILVLRKQVMEGDFDG